MITRTEYIQKLESMRGWGGRHPDSEIRKLFAAWTLPYDDLKWAMSYLADYGSTTPTSNCALWFLSCLRFRGCDHRVLRTPYRHRIGKSVSDVVTVAKAYGAWSQSEEDYLTYPDPGDGFIIVSPEHVVVVTGSEAATGAIVAVDGGQCQQDEEGNSTGHDCGTYVQERKRLLLATKPVYLVDPKKPYKDEAQKVPNGRHIYGKILSSKLPAFAEEAA